jgi:hypothetical protein
MEERSELQWREGIVLADPQRHFHHPHDTEDRGDDDTWNDNEILEVFIDSCLLNLISYSLGL